MQRDGVLRAVVLPTVISTAVMVGFLVCVVRALAETRVAEHVHGGYGGLGAAVGISLMTSVADRRSRQGIKDRLPPGLTPAQRVRSWSRPGPGRCHLTRSCAEKHAGSPSKAPQIAETGPARQLPCSHYSARPSG